MRGDARSSDWAALVRQSRRLLDQAFRVAGIGGWEFDLAAERLRWTESVYHLHDIEPGTRLHRRDILELYTDASRQKLETIRSEAIRCCHGFAIDVELRTALGSMRWVRITTDVATEAGKTIRIFGAQQDVTAERAAWERLRLRAECDALTGLANRGVFDARYRDVVVDATGHGGVAALVLVDLDQFKAINDGLGHAAGDECLRQTARRLRESFPDGSLIARLGGDEFALLLPAPARTNRIAPLLRRAAERLSEPILWNGRVIDVSASLGAAWVGAPSLFDRADAALYAAKAAGRGGVVVDGRAGQAPVTALPRVPASGGADAGALDRSGS